ncbi:type IV pilus biogenesis/stability protein PilW [Litorivivens sp.]|uniref:type IV pilus biogenesis/stability protein PilW n=1 Tax=Litorivivens sp. TaxID=2020868 RepID=UPI00356656F9
MSVRSLIQPCLILLGSALLSACVTTTDSPYSDKKNEAKALELSSQLARTYIHSGEWNAAKRHLRYAIETDPKNVEAHEGLALVFQNTGELELAEKHYQSALKYGSENSRVRNNYAAFLFGLERYNEAAKEFERVVEDVLYEGRLNAFLNLGRCYEKLDRPKDAVTTYKRAYFMDKVSRPAMLGLARSNYALGDYPSAQAFYDEYRRLSDKQSAASLWLGIRLADVFGDQNTHASYALALKNLYPKSREYLEYKAYLAAQNGGDESE